MANGGADWDDFKNDMFGFVVVCIAIAMVVTCFSIAIKSEEANCYKGAAPYVDCDLFEYCPPDAKVIDLHKEYVEKHPDAPCAKE